MKRSIDRKWWVLAAIGTGSFMAALDGSVVNTILPVVRTALGSDVATIEWTVTIYLLVISGLLLSFGRLGDLRGHRSVYLWGFGIFVLGSALCGAAPTAEALIAARGLQAVGGAMIASNSPAIVTGNFPATERGRALGTTAMMTYLGLTVGPSLGGWLAQTFSWRSVFYINVPVGLLALILSLAFVPHDEPTETSRKFDLPGALTFMAGLVSLLLGLNKGADWGWTSLPTLGSIAAAFLLLGIFVWLESRSPNPMLDLGLFRIPLFTASTVNAVFNYICVYTLMFLVPFYLIQGRGLNPAQAGLLLTVQPIIMAIAAPISGTLSDRIGSRLPGMIGMSLLSLGLLILSRMTIESPVWVLVLGMAICGLGTGIFISPNNSALMGSAPKQRQGIASGILASARNVGMVLGIGLAGAILLSHLTANPASGLVAGVRGGFLAAAGVAVLGILAAAVKER